MSDDVAVMQGFTKQVIGSASDYELYLLIQPDTDLDDTFKAWDTDEQVWIFVNGWLFTFNDHLGISG